MEWSWFDALVGAACGLWGAYVTRMWRRIESKLDKADKQLMIFCDLMARLLEVLEKKDESNNS